MPSAAEEARRDAIETRRGEDEKPARADPRRKFSECPARIRHVLENIERSDDIKGICHRCREIDNIPGGDCAHNEPFVCRGLSLAGRFRASHSSPRCGCFREKHSQSTSYVEESASRGTDASELLEHAPRRILSSRKFPKIPSVLFRDFIRGVERFRLRRIGNESDATPATYPDGRRSARLRFGNVVSVGRERSRGSGGSCVIQVA